MMQSLTSVVFSFVSALTLTAATQAIYINNSPVNAPPDVAPQIDATAFWNRSVFNINSASFGGTIPYQTQNTLYFTNDPSGVISGSPGYRFDFWTNSFRLGMDWWVNKGSVSGGTWLLVNSTNISSTGPMAAGSAGLIRLVGRNINLSGNGLRTGQLTNAFFGGGSTFGTNYSNPAGVSETYWGTGTNNTLNGQGPPMALDQGNFQWPFITSPLHEVIFNFGGFLFTNFTSVGGFGYGAFVYTNRTSPSNYTVQVAFVPTNSFDTNLSTEVRFFTPGENGGADITVEFRLRDFDIATQSFQTNAIYLVDHSGFVTNIFLAQPFFGNAPNRRPNTYELFRSTPFEFAFGTAGNATYNNSLIYNPSYASNAVTALYAAYGAQIASPTLTNGALPGSVLTDPTNSPGRIEIIGAFVNLDRTRIRAESTVIIKTPELGGGKVARVDAPFLHYDLGSSLPELVISNLAPAFVRRLFGQINAWSAVWDNIEVTPTATNFIKFHVLIVDNFLQTLTPVTLTDFAVRANHLTINDNLTVRRALRINSPGINITGGLTLPPGSEWSHTNIQGLVNFTNSGVVNVTQSARFGIDPAAQLQNFINSGTNMAASQAIRAWNFQNSGCVVAKSGVLELEAETVSLPGKPTILFTNVFTNIFFDPFRGGFFTNVATNVLTNSFGAKLAAASDMDIQASSVTMSNAYLLAGTGGGGTLRLAVDNLLVDGGAASTNIWEASAGVQVSTLPGLSDLLATRITSRVPNFVQALHIWPAVDRGPMVGGFKNNLAVGKLILDGVGAMSHFRFEGAGPQCALYVDYLEFLNYATNYNSTTEPTVSIADNLTIYFANANVTPGKLDGRFNGRLRWVKTFTGPCSSTNIVYPSGRTYTFNIGLAQDKDLDSDGDGTVNGEDPTPFYVDESIDMRIALTNAPSRRVLVSWHTLANSFNQLEYRNNIDFGAWQVATNFVHTAAGGRVTVQVPTPGATRFYRVRVDPPAID